MTLKEYLESRDWELDDNEHLITYCNIHPRSK